MGTWRKTLEYLGLAEVPPRAEIHLRHRVSVLEAQVAELARLAGVDPRRLPTEAPSPCSPEVADLARAGKNIQAIKLHREQTGADLASAKQDVEAIAFGRG